jgi:hypothetical protein
VKLGCTRSGSAIITTLADDHGYSHVEACTLTADHRMEICSGTAELADGSSHDFVYAFDRK